MLPVNLDLSRLPTLLVGPADAVAARDAQLRPSHGARIQHHVCEELDPAGLPSLSGVRILMICAQELPGAELLAQRAREEGLLLWMEDRREFCDFHLTAMLRRGDLTISIGTAGKCPGLARRLRRHLESLFPPVWAEHLETLSQQRTELRGQGATPRELIAATDRMISERGWL